MTPEFIEVSAEVIPVLILALGIQTRKEIGGLIAKLEADEPTRASIRTAVMLTVWHAGAIAALGVGEIRALQALAGLAPIHEDMSAFILIGIIVGLFTLLASPLLVIGWRVAALEERHGAGDLSGVVGLALIIAGFTAVTAIGGLVVLMFSR